MNRQHSNKSRKALVALLTIVALSVVQRAWAQTPDLYYIECEWNGYAVTSSKETYTKGTYVELRGRHPQSTLEMKSYVYAVMESNTEYHRIIVPENEEVQLILCDGAQLTAYVKIGAGGTLNIYGQEENSGKLVAKGPYELPGIGISTDGDVALNIHGGDIEAWGGKYGAGIGGGKLLKGATVVIYGGNVKAYGGDYGAGIGGGQDASGGTVTIYGGNVYADGGLDAAGIGSGEETVFRPDINGGKLTVHGGNVFADGTGWGAGIGGGEDADGATVVINGGKVEAYAGSDAGSKNGSAIGSEDGDDHRGSLSIANKMMVHAGSSPSSYSLFPYETRVPACYFRPYTRIEPCDHQGRTYTVSGTTANDTHTLNCSHCLDRTTERHTFKDGSCTVCHVSGSINTISIYLPEAVDGIYTDGHYASTPRTEQLVTGSTFTLPSPPVSHLPSGVSFAGWCIGTPTGLGIKSYWVQSGETVLEPGTPYTVSADVSITARYNGLEISLSDNTDNSEILYLNNGKKTKSVTLTGHVLYKDDSWNTLCLPFSLSNFTGTPLEGATVKKLSSTSLDDGTLTFFFSEDLTSIEAGTPYIVKWAEGKDIVSPVFESVTIRLATAKTETTHVDFIGNYSPENLNAGDNRVLYLCADNMLYYPEAAMTINAFRAFFQLKGLKVDDPANGINNFALNFGDESTEIRDISNLSGANDHSTLSGSWLTLNGSRLSSKPTAKGIYIHNGNKIVIK